jgi:hypothetical protein
MFAAFAAYVAFHPARFLPLPSKAPCAGALPVSAADSSCAGAPNAEGKAGVELGTQPSCLVHAWPSENLTPV